MPGQLVAWDPSNARSVDAQPWSRLMVVEVGALADLAGDEESNLPPNTVFPEPVLSDGSA